MTPKKCILRSCLKIAVALLFFAAGWGEALAEKPDLTLAIKADPKYDQVYPYYVEVCAVSRIRPVDGPEGGGWGHALMYLKGVCRDKSAAFPKVRMCEPGEVDLQTPEAGMGISVDKMFKNVNWMAVPGKQLFYHGNLAEGERLTREHFEATVQEAVRQGFFRGIELHDVYMTSKPKTQSNEEFIARQAIGTDYAVEFGRTSFCARLPVTHEMTGKMVNYLNSRNEEIFSGKTVFKWSAYYDNCAHTVHNALAAAGIWKAKSINQFRVKQFFNRAIPANEFVAFALLGKKHPGALIKKIPAHEPNDLFGTDYKLFVLEGPFRKGKTKKIRKMISNPRHTDLQANLLYFEKRYESILQKPSGKWRSLLHGKDSGAEQSVFQRSVKEDLAEIQQKLQYLNT